MDDSFALDQTMTGGMLPGAMHGTGCTTDFVYIEGAGGSVDSIVGPNKFCGSNLNFAGDSTTAVRTNAPVVGKLFI